MNETAFITLYAINNTVNIIQIFALIVLSVLLELDYHLLKINAGAFWRRTYAHLVLIGFILMLRDQVDDRSNSRLKTTVTLDI